MADDPYTEIRKPLPAPGPLKVQRDEVEVFWDAVEKVYWVGVNLVGFVTFVGAWIYAIATYGLFLGGGLGWIPAAVLGVIAALLWPLLAMALFGLFVLAKGF